MRTNRVARSLNACAKESFARRREKHVIAHATSAHGLRKKATQNESTRAQK